MNPFTATSFRPKISILAEIRAAKGHTPGASVDCIAVAGQTFIAPGITDAYAWGGSFYIETEDNTAGGQMFGAEVGVKNEGSVVTSIDSAANGYGSDGGTKQKVGLWIATFGSNKITALIANTSAIAGGAQYGMYLRSIAHTYAHFRNPVSGAIGIDMPNSANWAEAIRLPNVASIEAYNAAGSGTYQLLGLDASDGLCWAATHAQSRSATRAQPSAYTERPPWLELPRSPHRPAAAPSTPKPAPPSTLSAPPLPT